MSQLLNKIRVNPKESEELQLYLFKKGFKWNSGSIEVRNLQSLYICIYSDKTLAYANEYYYNEDSIINYRDFMKMSLSNDKMRNTKSGEKLIYIGKSRNLTFLKYEQIYDVINVYLANGIVYSKYFVIKDKDDVYDIREDNMYNFIKLTEYRKLKLVNLNNV